MLTMGGIGCWIYNTLLYYLYNFSINLKHSKIKFMGKKSILRNTNLVCYVILLKGK